MEPLRDYHTPASAIADRLIALAGAYRMGVPHPTQRFDAFHSIFVALLEGLTMASTITLTINTSPPVKVTPQKPHPEVIQTLEATFISQTYTITILS